MMRTFLILATLVLLSTTAEANAQAPDSQTGPQGCDWEAEVTSVQQQPGTTLNLTLTKMVGGCVMSPCSSGKVGDVVHVPVETQGVTQYVIGQTIHVWLDGQSASLKHPHC